MPLIQLTLSALIDRTRTTQPLLYRRYLTMFLDGMRGDRGPISELPVSAISNEQTQARDASSARLTTPHPVASSSQPSGP